MLNYMQHPVWGFGVGYRVTWIQCPWYSGVQLQSDLKRGIHIDKVVAEAKRVLSMLHRILPDADTPTRMIAYNARIWLLSMRPTYEK